jgi:hypothetical protein
LLLGSFLIGLSTGVQGQKSSYIAVPTAIHLSIPNANPGIFLTLALGI